MFSPQFSSMCLPTSTPSFITSLPILQSAHPRNFLSNPNLSSLKRFHPSSSSSSSPKTPFSFQMTMPQQPHINVSSDVPSSVATLVLQKSAEALSKTGKFTVALSGGSLPKILAQALPSSVDISKWRVFLADERIVPLDDADSNYRQIQSQIPGLSVIPIDPTLSPRECALNYQRLVTEALGEKPVFDAVLLGLGPDGHTCSLFPGHPLVSCFHTFALFSHQHVFPLQNRVTFLISCISFFSNCP